MQAIYDPLSFWTNPEISSTEVLLMNLLALQQEIECCHQGSTLEHFHHRLEGVSWKSFLHFDLQSDRRAC